MRPLFLFLILLLFLSCARKRHTVERDPGLTYNWKQSITTASLSTISGAAWGIHETIVHHPNSIPYSWNRRFWGPDSWRNKYHKGDPMNGPAYFGSTTFLAWTTDAKHLFGTVHRASMFAAGVCITIGDKRPPLHYLADTGISFVAFTLGFHSAYSLAFKK